MDFLMFLSQLPASPSSLRVLVWRRMKAAGALGLQNGVWVLPRAPEQEQFLQELLATVESQGASAQIFTVQPANPGIQAKILERFQADREREYAEFGEQCQALLAEIEKETARQKFTFAELEENEQNLLKLTGWLSKIQARNYFESPPAAGAQAALETCRQALEHFAGQVYAQDGLSPFDPPTNPEAGSDA